MSKKTTTKKQTSPTKKQNTRRTESKKFNLHRAMQVVEEMAQKAETELTEFKKSLGGGLSSICTALIHGGELALTAVGSLASANSLYDALTSGGVDKALLYAYDQVREITTDEELAELRDNGCPTWPYIRKAEADAYAAFIQQFPARTRS